MKTYLIKLGLMLVPFYKITRLFQQVLDYVFTGVICRLINVLGVGNFSVERPVYIAGGVRLLYIVDILGSLQGLVLFKTTMV